MGGIRSGRQGGRPTVEDGLRLDRARWRALRQIRPGCCTAGRVTWTRHDGRVTSEIGFIAELTDPHAAWMQLCYTLTQRDGTVLRCDYRVSLTTTRPRFGGTRWWFVCPVSSRRVRVLHLPPGATTFASRQVWRRGYHSQRQTKTDRAMDRSLAARKKLGITDPNLLERPDCPQPRGMSRRTYQRQLAILRDSHDRLLRKKQVIPWDRLPATSAARIQVHDLRHTVDTARAVAVARPQPRCIVAGAVGPGSAQAYEPSTPRAAARAPVSSASSPASTSWRKRRSCPHRPGRRGRAGPRDPAGKEQRDRSKGGGGSVPGARRGAADGRDTARPLRERGAKPAGRAR